MTTHRANCADCAWSYEADDHEAVTDALERHSRKEQHHVDFERAVATDGGLDYDVVEAIRGFLREDLDRGQWKVYYAKRIAKNVPYSPHKVGYYLGRICGLDPRVDAIDIEDPELEIEPWDSAASRRRWRVERVDPVDGERETDPLVTDGGGRLGREIDHGRPCNLCHNADRLKGSRYCGSCGGGPVTDDSPGDGESRDGSGGVRPVPPGVPNTPEGYDDD
jgi:hypothetical protein